MSADQLAIDGWRAETERWAHLSDDGVYRYILGRRWADGPLVGWVMLNPSTADASVDDPTIRRCVGFARTWGYAGVLVGNVYALRATDPRELTRVGYTDAVGPGNAAALEAVADLVEVVCAWGTKAEPYAAQSAVADLHDAGARLRCLGRTKGGHPRHPLYVAGAQALEDFS